VDGASGTLTGTLGAIGAVGVLTGAAGAVGVLIAAEGIAGACTGTAGTAGALVGARTGGEVGARSKLISIAPSVGKSIMGMLSKSLIVINPSTQTTVDFSVTAVNDVPFASFTKSMSSMGVPSTLASHTRSPNLLKLRMARVGRR
jgi:hypothetical protein